jgi:hypothetical protein
MAVTTTEQIFSLAQNPVRGNFDLIRGSLTPSDGPLRTAAIQERQLHSSKPTTCCVK